MIVQDAVVLGRFRLAGRTFVVSEVGEDSVAVSDSETVGALITLRVSREGRRVLSWVCGPPWEAFARAHCLGEVELRVQAQWALERAARKCKGPWAERALASASECLAASSPRQEGVVSVGA